MIFRHLTVVYRFSSRHIGKTSKDILRISAAFLGRTCLGKVTKAFPAIPSGFK